MCLSRGEWRRIGWKWTRGSQWQWTVAVREMRLGIGGNGEQTYRSSTKSHFGKAVCTASINATGMSNAASHLEEDPSHHVPLREQIPGLPYFRQACFEYSAENVPLEFGKNGDFYVDGPIVATFNI